MASAAAADDARDTEVPPLAHGESPPEDAPNYFDTRELGAATLTTFAVCQDTIARAYPDAVEATQAAYCGCFSDAARWNVRGGHPAAPTESQVATCIDTTRARAASPFARRFTVPTGAIADTFDACLAAEAARSSSDRDFVCGCATDAWLADHGKPARLEDDLARCAAAGRYRAAIGENPTLHQFAAIRPAPAAPSIRLDLAPSGAAVPHPSATERSTRCSDGTYAHPASRATCAYHSGISGGHHRRR